MVHGQGTVRRPVRRAFRPRHGLTLSFNRPNAHRTPDTPQVDLAVPAFGYKNHVAIDRRHRLISASPAIPQQLNRRAADSANTISQPTRN
ncbi:hypothetical protein GC173_08300 [bacterium]|nr:hypothetical protein [bacterium]